MWFSRQKFLVLALCALASATYGCSNVEQASDNSGAEASTEGSSADSVGSIPEDLLAQEEKGQGTENAETADPFSDLKDGEKAADAGASSDSMSLIENGDESSAAASHSSGSGNMENYSVKSGDTLMKIAFTIYGDIDRWKDLQSWNPKIKKASALSKGMKIKYEAPLSPFEPEQHAHSYVIQKGDTLANIADEVYGKKMKFKKLQNYNAKLITNPNRIFAGFTIFYDISAKEIAEADARRKERMASGGGGMTPEPNSMVPDASSLVPSAISPPADSLSAPAPIAIAPTPAPSGQMPAPASTNDIAPPPPPPPAAN